MKRILPSVALLALSACASSVTEEEVTGTDTAALTVYEVGPGKPYANINAVASRLKPGDVVNVSGNVTYGGDVYLTASGTAASKITIRGVRVNGKRPILSGGDNTIHIEASHTVLEGFEITGGARRCVFHHADDVTIRDTVVHDCPKQGILGADEDSGSLLLDRVEVYRSGGGDRDHQIYMATDETAHPGSVFRMQNCYIHDGNGGNNVKSRAERNEIYYNWIEGAYYRELELIGPDGQDPVLARENSDVVGNVLNHTGTFYTVRLGGDGTGDTNGRYRFVNNTIILRGATRAVFQLFDGIGSLEASNNVLYSTTGSAVNVFSDADASWLSGRAVSGTNNWFATNATNIPSELRNSVRGTNPGLGATYAPTATSPLLNAGAANALVPTFVPPPRTLPAAATARPVVSAIDIGAYEYGTATTPPTNPTTPPTTPTTPPTTPPPPADCPATLLANGSFEANLNGWDTSDATLSRVSGGYCGSYSAKVTSAATDYSIDDLGATLASPAAGTYRATAWVRSENAGVTAQIVLREKLANGTRVSSRSTTVTVGTSWQRITVDRATASGSTGLEVYVAASGGGAFFVDGIGLTKN